MFYPVCPLDIGGRTVAFPVVTPDGTRIMGGDHSYGDDCPIAAFATTPGGSALTLLRCCGKDALELAEKVFSAPEKLRQAAGNTILHGWIIAPNNEKIDEVLLSVFHAPKSYTGEDGLDISCHGGSAAGRGVMDALHAAGFRDALPGEFTFRAFMNGKLDLTRGESVMELVCAKTDSARRYAINRLSGVLEAEINAIKKLLVEVLAGVEILLDYSEDEIETDETAGRFAGRQRTEEALSRLRALAQSWRRQQIYQEGLLAVIAGRPNAGKSSLFNLLLKEERSIVTAIPGTTRDWIEAWVAIEGIPLRLADTAGLRDDSPDAVEKLGVDRSRALLAEAELVIYLIDGAEGITVEDEQFIAEFSSQPSKPLIVLWNKADITPAPLGATALSSTSVISISAKTGEGMAELSAAIVKAAMPPAMGAQAEAAGDDAHDPALGSVRQKNLVEGAAAALEQTLALAERNEPLDLIAPLLREAVNALGEITGEVSTADLLEEMFSRFCVGK